MTLSALVSAACRSPSRTSHWSESSAAIRVSGNRLTCWPASPAVGNGAVGLGPAVWSTLCPAHAAASAITHHAPRTTHVCVKELSRCSRGECEAPVHHDHLSGDVPCRLAAQKYDDARHVLRLCHAPPHSLPRGTA